jgi:hypothetical protein
MKGHTTYKQHGWCSRALEFSPADFLEANSGEPRRLSRPRSDLSRGPPFQAPCAIPPLLRGCNKYLPGNLERMGTPPIISSGPPTSPPLRRLRRRLGDETQRPGPMEGQSFIALIDAQPSCKACRVRGAGVALFWSRAAGTQVIAEPTQFHRSTDPPGSTTLERRTAYLAAAGAADFILTCLAVAGNLS